MIRNAMCLQAGASGISGGIAVAMPSYVSAMREQSLRPATWRAAVTAAVAPAHVVPAPLTKREADFFPTGIPGGGPPV